MKRCDVPADVLRGLNNGTLQSRNLTECLVVDFAKLLAAIAPELARQARSRIKASDGIVKRMSITGQLLSDHGGENCYERFSSHPSDTVRGWAAFVLALTPDQPLQTRIQKIRILADDAHFGVREWAWLALRQHIAADISCAIRLLTPFTGDSSANIRRFATESTRPRGVWCSHIGELKRDPDLGLPLLEPLRADPSRYVQDSVANWLNDAGKSRPEWLEALCARWNGESPGPETKRICQRALRSLRP